MNEAIDTRSEFRDFKTPAVDPEFFASAAVWEEAMLENGVVVATHLLRMRDAVPTDVLFAVVLSAGERIGSYGVTARDRAWEVVLDVDAGDIDAKRAKKELARALGVIMAVAGGMRAFAAALERGDLTAAEATEIEKAVEAEIEAANTAEPYLS